MHLTVTTSGKKNQLEICITLCNIYNIVLFFQIFLDIVSKLCDFSLVRNDKSIIHLVKK